MTLAPFDPLKAADSQACVHSRRRRGGGGNTAAGDAARAAAARAVAVRQRHDGDGARGAEEGEEEQRHASPLSECAALLVFYESTNGKRWHRKRGWAEALQAHLADTASRCPGPPLGGWEGVSVDARGHVTGLALAANNLSGPLPCAALAALPWLQTLQLQHNGLRGALRPDPFCAMRDLVAVTLHHNKLGGAPPPSLFCGARRASLKYVNLSHNRLCGVLPLPEGGAEGGAEGGGAGPCALERLLLHHNRLGELAEPPWRALGVCARLRALNLAHNSFCLACDVDIDGGAASLARCGGLRLVSVAGNRVLRHPGSTRISPANSADVQASCARLKAGLCRVLRAPCTVVTQE
eukprot:g4823.t1